MWNDLTMQQKADVISMAVKAGMRDMKSIRSFYDEASRSRRFEDGGHLFEDGGSTAASIPMLSSTPKLKFDAPVIEKVRPEYEEIKPAIETPVEPVKQMEPIIPGLSPQQPISDSRFSRSHPIFKDEYDYMNSDAFLTRVKKMTNDNDKARILATNMRNSLYHTNLPNKAFYDYTSNSQNSGFRLSESGPYMHKIYYGRVNDVPGFTKRSVIAHELGHSVYDTNKDGSLLDYHLLSPQYTNVLQRGRHKTPVDNETRRHDHMDTERIADIRALQQQAKDAGIWDKTTGVDMTPEMYNKLKQTYPEHRSFDMWNDEDLRWLINTTAQNNTPTLDDSNRNYLLANGGHLFANGGIKKYTGDSEDIGYDANSMRFYEKATGKELGDSAILDEVIVNGRNRINDYLTEANDNTSIYNVPHREYNLHLKDRAEQGAREAAIWREEHPTMSAWGDAAASVPLAVASMPLIAGGAEALAGTSAGQAISSGLLSLSNLAKGSTIAGAPAWAWADAGLTSAFGAHGIDELSKGNVTPEALLEVAPLGQLAKPLYKGVLKSGIRQYNPRHVIKQITAENAASMTPELDAAYKAAVESGNRPEALRLLEQAYLRSGIPKTDITVTPEGHAVGWYHGSEWGNHTIFDSSAMNATIGGTSAHGRIKGNFLTTDIPSAMRYAGSSRYSSANVPEYTSPITFGEKIKKLFGRYKPRRLHPAERVGDFAPKPKKLFDTKGKAPIEHLEKTDNVVYPMYVNPGEDVMTLDFQGNPWSQSPVIFPNNFYLRRHIRDDIAKTFRNEIIPYKDYEAAHRAWMEDPINIHHGSTSLDKKYFDDGIRSIEGFNSSPRYERVRLIEELVPNTTNGAVQTAAKEGKTSVLMRNVIDSNGGPEGIGYAIDDFVTLKPNQQKLADITYDDNGKLIPLSQRFNWSKNDIRYGLLPFGIGLAGLGLVNKE